MLVHDGQTLCGDALEVVLGYTLSGSRKRFDEDDVLVRRELLDINSLPS